MGLFRVNLSFTTPFGDMQHGEIVEILDGDIDAFAAPIEKGWLVPLSAAIPALVPEGWAERIGLDPPDNRTMAGFLDVPGIRDETMVRDSPPEGDAVGHDLDDADLIEDEPAPMLPCAVDDEVDPPAEASV